MIKKIIYKYRNFINKPLENRIDELEKINKNLIFLINQTVDMNDVKTSPSIFHLQEQQYDVLLKFSKFLEKIKTDYFLIYGTLLGAVRHKGFVPWDDDVDVGILQESLFKIIDNENLLQEFGLGLSSPFSKNNNYDFPGWNKIYSLKTRSYISFFTFDIVNGKSSNEILDIRTMYNKKAYDLRRKYRKNVISFELLQSKLLKLNEEYYSKVDIRTKKDASNKSYLIKNICNYKQPNITNFGYLYPLKEMEFSLQNEKKNVFPVPNNPDDILKDFYNEDYMEFPDKIYPLHPHKFKEH